MKNKILIAALIAIGIILVEVTLKVLVAFP